MTKRIAYFITKSEIENFFNAHLSGETILEPHYNLARGQHIVVIRRDDDNSKITSRVRWGKEPENNLKKSSNMEEDRAELIKNADSRVVIPISGFYIWKEDNGNDQPFFVRMLNNEPMAVCGLIFKSGSKNEFCEIVHQESNPLIQPMSSLMPVLLDIPLMEEWLSDEEDAEKILKKAKSRFLITDITVHRVTKDVNDLSENHPDLIQPIPK